MAQQRLGRLELQIMEIFWNRGACSIREVQEAFPERGRPAYTTIKTTVYRLERKKAITLTKRIGKANIFEAAISRGEAQRGLVNELLGLFGGQAKPVMAHLIESGQLTLEDVEEARRDLRRLSRKGSAT